MRICRFSPRIRWRAVALILRSTRVRSCPSSPTLEGSNESNQYHRRDDARRCRGVCASSTRPRHRDVRHDGLRVRRPPYDIETRPYVMYNGVPNYYSDGLWYRRTGQGWGYYRNEPAPLMQRRPVRVQSAPPAYRVGPQQAPPAYRLGPQQAPPAYRRPR